MTFEVLTSGREKKGHNQGIQKFHEETKTCLKLLTICLRPQRRMRI